MKSKSRLFAAMIALSIFAAPAAAYAGKPYRETAARAAAARVSASRNASFAARNQSRAIAPRNFSFARNFQAAPTNRGNRVIFDRSNWERNAALNNYASQYANQPRGYYNNYAAPIPIGSNCQLGGVNNYPSAYGEQGYGYGQTGIGQPALASYRGRLLAQKASLLAQLNSASSFMERPYLREQLAEVNKKLGAVDEDGYHRPRIRRRAVWWIQRVSAGQPARGIDELRRQRIRRLWTAGRTRVSAADAG